MKFLPLPFKTLYHSQSLFLLHFADVEGETHKDDGRNILWVCVTIMAANVGVYSEAPIWERV